MGHSSSLQQKNLDAFNSKYVAIDCYSDCGCFHLQHVSFQYFLNDILLYTLLELMSIVQLLESNFAQWIWFLLKRILFWRDFPHMGLVSLDGF